MIIVSCFVNWVVISTLFFPFYLSTENRERSYIFYFKIFLNKNYKYGYIKILLYEQTEKFRSRQPRKFETSKIYPIIINL